MYCCKGEELALERCCAGLCCFYKGWGATSKSPVEMQHIKKYRCNWRETTWKHKRGFVPFSVSWKLLTDPLVSVGVVSSLPCWELAWTTQVKRFTLCSLLKSSQPLASTQLSFCIENTGIHLTCPLAVWVFPVVSRGRPLALLASSRICWEKAGFVYVC